ncbi:hypothetical protein MKW98_022138 [Papaver atlanticum]|uniref:Uncharacterized protein n=1 Tax=Papaver atlanticum TaxID=357466 RepID=A0AAD4XPY2_9MAGN|nr:hypothetical protein MKW98_022138 [Papaver atlanticum]
MSNFTASRITVALTLCLLLLRGFSVDAAGRISGDCHYLFQCEVDLTCNADCKSHGYSRGLCKIRGFPSSKVDPELIHIDYEQPGDCCCLV